MPELATRASILVDAARKSGLLAREGRATAATSTTITDTENLIHQNNNDLQHHEVYIQAGTGVDQDPRRTSGSTSGSSLITVATFDTTPDTTSDYLLFQPSVVFISRLLRDGVDGAMRRILPRFLVSKTNYEYVLQDLLWGFGSMQRWTSGTTSAPDGMTLDGNSSIARSSTIPNQLLFSAAVTSDGSNSGSLSRSVSQFGQYHDLTVSLYGWLFANTGSRVTLRVTDGISTNNSDALTTTSRWFEIGPGRDINIEALEIAEQPTELTASMRISSGGAVVANVTDMRLILGGHNLQRFELPSVNGYGSELTTFRWVNSVIVESNPGTWEFPKANEINPDFITFPDEEGTRYMNISKLDLTTMQNRRLLIRGEEGPALLTSNTGTTSVDSDFLSAYAAWYALRSLPNKSSDNKTRMDELERDWRELDRLIRDKPTAGSIAVEKR